MSGKLSAVAAVDSGSPLPPGPRMPSALQAVGWAERPLPFMERCHKRYGDTFTLRIRHAGTWVFLCNPEDVKRVFTAEADLLGVGEANSLLGPILGSRSVMLLEEPEHMSHRRRMLPSFHGPRMERYAEMTAEVARREIASWPVGEPFALWPRMQEITLGVIMRTVFGELDTDHLRRLRELLRELTEWMNVPRRQMLLAALGPRSMVGNAQFRAMMSAVESAVLEEVRRRRAQPPREQPGREQPGHGQPGYGQPGHEQSRREQPGHGQPGHEQSRHAPPDSGEREDVVTMLERAHHEDGSPLSDQELRDELITLLIDGPTSTSLAWAFERLLRHPDKLARVREEVRSRAGAEGAYLDAVIKETLRLCPPVPVVVRRLLAPMRLGGYTVPAGATVAPCVYLMHRREEVYPRPRSFLPERFLGRSPGTYTWIPFGGGVRRCLAASFALLEMKQVIQTVLAEVELRPAERRSERVARSSIAFAPDRHALAVVVGRAPVRSTMPALAGAAHGPASPSVQ
jgi:cytochrome P450 family 135